MEANDTDKATNTILPKKTGVVIKEIEPGAPVDAVPKVLDNEKLSAADQAFLQTGLGHFTGRSKKAEDNARSEELVQKVSESLSSRGIRHLVDDGALRQVVRNTTLPLSAKKLTHLKKLLRQIEPGTDVFTQAIIIDTINSVLVEGGEKRERRKQPKPVVPTKERTPTQVWKEHKQQVEKLQKNPYYQSLEVPQQIPLENIQQHFVDTPAVMNTALSAPITIQGDHPKKTEEPEDDFETFLKNLLDKAAKEEAEVEEQRKPLEEQPKQPKSILKPKRPNRSAEYAQPPSTQDFVPYNPYAYPAAPTPSPYMYPPFSPFMPYGYPHSARPPSKKMVPYYEEGDADDESSESEEEIEKPRKRRHKKARVVEESEEEDVTVERRKPQAPKPTPVEQQPVNGQKIVTDYMRQLAEQFLANGRMN